jgi:putative serine protease PepD
MSDANRATAPVPPPAPSPPAIDPFSTSTLPLPPAWTPIGKEYAPGPPQIPAQTGPGGYPPPGPVPPSLVPPGRPGFGAPAQAERPRRRGRLLALIGVTALVAALAGGGAGFAGGLAADGTGLPGIGGRSTGAATPGNVAEVAAAVQPSVVTISVIGATENATGSGFVLDDDGHVLTNNHVVEGARSIQLTRADGGQVTANLVGADASNDLAVLQAEDTSGLRPAELGRSSDLRVGETVLAFGSPLGLSGTVTSGIVSAVQRPVQIGDGPQRPAIQTDASINPGNSGGPLVNSSGQVIGVNTVIATIGQGASTGGSIGIGFAIPIDRADEVADQIIG